MIGDILQPTHLIFIFVVALLVLGPKRLPEVGRSLGKGIRDFRGAMAGIEDETRGHFDLTQAPDAPAEPPEPVDTVVAAPAPAVPEFDQPPDTVTAAAPPAGPTLTAPAATVTAPVRTASATASGSGLAEPDPGEYAD
jgi:sec-independent protein translocase protein TatA